LEVGGAVRVSDYSSIGRTTTWNSNAVWEMNDQMTFRGTYGVAIRAPNLSELFSPPGQTFLQIADPCSVPVINGTVDAVIRANRIANCAAAGVPGGYVDPNPNSSNAGQAGGNTLLKAEKSRSWTASFIYQPEWLDRFSMVVDFYGIDIADAIATPTIQQTVNGCYDGTSLNPNFCSNFTRDPGTFEINFFNLSPVNFQSLQARGFDYALKYSFDLAEGWGQGGLVPGSIDFQLRGTYVMHRVNFVNVSDPNDQTELDGTVGFPKNRFLVTTAWNYGKFRLAHDLDYFTSQDFEEAESYIGNEDSGLNVYRKTGAWTQHDLTATYELNDNFSFRAGVVNLFDNEPPLRVLYDDLWDLFGRRYFIGAQANF
jgi:outer membrane receptor protein involved in Fe transport